MRLFQKKIFSQTSGSLFHSPVNMTEEFLKVFQLSPGGMCFSTFDSILVEANENFSHLFGYTRNEFVGMNVRTIGLVSNEESQRIKLLLKEKGKLENYEIKCRHKNGHIIYCLLNACPITINGINLILTSFSDISRVKNQNRLIEVQHKDLFDSVNSAKRIQDAILPTPELLKKTFSNSFVLFKPKAIVSGDFYWLETCNDKVYLAVADCTGHGVPGALLSIVGYNLLNESLQKTPEARPDEILNKLSNGIYKMLRQNSGNWCVKDGLEISMIAYNKENNIIEYAGARRPMFLVRNNELIKISPDRFPIGFHTGEHLQRFSNHTLQTQKGDAVYLFSDGYYNQFGGTKNKKFSALQFQQNLLSIYHLEMEEQKKILQKKFEDWMGSQPQIDDVLVLGIKI